MSSLLLTYLPPIEHDYSSDNYKKPSKSTPAYEVRNHLMEMMLEALTKNAGFVIPEVSQRWDWKQYCVEGNFRGGKIFVISRKLRCEFPDLLSLFFF